MSPAALPYSVLLLLTEFAIGSQLVDYAIDLRGQTTRSLVRLGAFMAVVVAAMALWVALEVPPLTSVNGYSLEGHFWHPARLHLALFAGLAAVYAVSLLRPNRVASRIAGGITAAGGLLALFFLAGLVEGPAWSFAGTLAGLLTGGLALGGVTLAMSLGHWYLVTPRLPERPLNELTLAVLGILVLQTALLVISLAVPGRLPLPAAALPAGQNPAVWLRAGVGLVLPIVLCFMAWRCSRAREMMSATGLLYLATGAVLAGQALACSLIFSAALPG
jgi:hypothetical protein